MKLKILFSILLLFLTLNCKAQITSGLTGIRDTSYSIQNELKKNLRNFPEISIAEVKPSSLVKEEMNLQYALIQKKTRSLHLDVFSPTKESTEKRTAVVFIHGGGWRSGDRSMHHSLARRLAEMGYVCITPEYRLSTEALYPAGIFDLKFAIRWLRKHARKYNIDVSRIVVAGHSAGGELAAFIGTTNDKNKYDVGIAWKKNISTRANAVIDIDGTLAFIHPESGEGDDSKKISAATYWFGYSKTENPDLWKDAAPLSHVNGNSPPFLFINSGVDRMHAGREDFIKILNEHHIYSEVKTFEGAPHTFCFFNPWFEPMVKTMDDFIKKIFKEKPQRH